MRMSSRWEKVGINPYMVLRFHSNVSPVSLWLFPQRKKEPRGESIPPTCGWGLRAWVWWSHKKKRLRTWTGLRQLRSFSSVFFSLLTFIVWLSLLLRLSLYGGSDSERRIKKVVEVCVRLRRGFSPYLLLSSFLHSDLDFGGIWRKWGIGSEMPNYTPQYQDRKRRENFPTFPKPLPNSPKICWKNNQNLWW